MEIIPLIINNNIKILSIFGLSKNCGKTTTLIKLIEEAKKNNLNIFVTSIGLDGEKFDSLYYFEKPLIKGYKGNLIVTSKSSLDKINIKFEIIRKFDIFTPLGELYLIKLMEDGYIEISGPMILKDLKKILDDARNYNIDLILIDGAVDRKIGTFFSDGVILQTGLNIGENINEIIEETIYYKDIFTIKKIEGDLKEKILKNYPEKKYLFIKNNYQEESDQILNKDYNNIFVKGAFTSEFFGYLKDKKNINIIVEHPTKVFLNREIYREMINSGIKFFTLKEVKLIGVSFSTFNQDNYFNKDDGKILFNKLKELIKPIIIFDVMEKSGE
ncbi:MAG: hypothetical protein ACPLWB_01530 [Caldisericia bacterium]